jgi:hypothetical protein
MERHLNSGSRSLRSEHQNRHQALQSYRAVPQGHVGPLARISERRLVQRHEDTLFVGDLYPRSGGENITLSPTTGHTQGA